MAKYNWKLVTPMFRNTAIGGLAGYIAGGSVSDSVGRDMASKEGALVGGVVGSITGLPFGKLAKLSLETGKVMGRGLKATPSSTIGAALRGADKAGKHAGVVFRRIKGRIVPVRMK